MVSYDDETLQRLFAEMEPKRRLQALKGGFRKEANQVRKTAIGNLRSTGIHSSRELEKNIRAIVFKKTAGFQVTIATKKRRVHRKKIGAIHWDNSVKTRTGKPYDLVVIWNEFGTEARMTKPKKGTKHRLDRDREAHSTGRIKRHRYMAETLEQVKDSVTEDLHKLVNGSVERIAKKYGCK